MPASRRRYSAKPVPKFIIDLSLPPASRWNNVTMAYRHLWPPLLRELRKGFGDDLDGALASGFVSRVADGLFAHLRAFGADDIVEEMCAIATGSGGALSVEDVVLLHTSLESVSGCTACITPSPGGGGAFIARTLDWDLQVLRTLTIEAIFVARPGVELMRCTTFAGYVGVLTGRRAGTFCAALNFRRPGPADDQTDCGGSPAWPAGLLLRYALGRCESYIQAVKMLSSSPLWAPCYVSVVGAGPDEACVLARGEGETLLARRGFSTCPAEGELLVQTNADWFGTSGVQASTIPEGARALDADQLRRCRAGDDTQGVGSAAVARAQWSPHP
jgi:N-acylethanolamine-hydrolysing acid amidase